MFGENYFVQLDFIDEEVQGGAFKGAAENVDPSFPKETCGLGISSSCACDSVILIHQISVGVYLWQLAFLVSLLQGLATHEEFNPKLDTEDICLISIGGIPQRLSAPS